MISNTTYQLKHDLEEVRSKIEDLEPFTVSYQEFKDLKDWFDTLEEHLKDHLETVENFICDIN